MTRDQIINVILDDLAQQLAEDAVDYDLTDKELRQITDRLFREADYYITRKRQDAEEKQAEQWWLRGEVEA
jgi:hypothetical protein